MNPLIHPQIHLGDPLKCAEAVTGPALKHFNKWTLKDMSLI